MGVDLVGSRDDEELGGVEEKETEIRIYCTGKESIFHKRGANTGIQPTMLRFCEAIQIKHTQVPTPILISSFCT